MTMDRQRFFTKKKPQNTLNIKEQISKLDCFKNKNFCSLKDIIRRGKRPTEREKLFAICASYKDPVY